MLYATSSCTGVSFATSCSYVVDASALTGVLIVALGCALFFLGIRNGMTLFFR